MSEMTKPNSIDNEEMEICPTDKLAQFLEVVYPEISGEILRQMPRPELIAMMRESPGKIELKGREFHLGRAVKFRRPYYAHYGVICAIRHEKVYVVHYSGDPTSKIDSRVRVDCLDEIAASSAHEMQNYPDQIEPFEAIANALSRLNENTYNLVTNNCEHFASWCCTNRHRSMQVRTATATLAAFATVAFVGITTALLGRLLGTENKLSADELHQRVLEGKACPHCGYQSDTKWIMQQHISAAHGSTKRVGGDM